MAKPGVGIIGTGWGTRVQVPAFREAGLEIVALAGSQARKTQRIAAELDIPHATGDWRTLLERDNVELVSIVTPPFLHCEMTIAALEAGKHVLCEKPTAFNADEARNMLRTAENHPDQIALVDHELRFVPAMQAARQLVLDGGIGTLRHGEVRFINSSRANFRRIWNWWSDVAQGGGILGAIGSHQIDTVRYLLNDDVTAVSGHLRTYITQRPISPPTEADMPSPTREVTSDDFATFYLKMAQGGIVSVMASMVARTNESQSITLYGDEGTMRVQGGRLLYARPDDEFYDITPAETIAIPEHIRVLYPDYAEATIYMGHALRVAMAGDRSTIEPAATMRDGLRTQQVIDAVRASSASGQGWIIDLLEEAA
jgi:predicted dehydrogenase